MAKVRMERALLDEIKAWMAYMTRDVESDGTPCKCSSDLIGFDVHDDHAALYFANRNGCGVFGIVQIEHLYGEMVRSQCVFITRQTAELLLAGQSAIWHRKREREQQEEQERRLAS